MLEVVHSSLWSVFASHVALHQIDYIAGDMGIDVSTQAIVSSTRCGGLL